MENNNAQNVHGKAVILLIVTAVLWSSAGILIKLVNWNSIAIAGMRSGIASIFMLFIIKKPEWKWNPTKIWGTIAYASMLILFVSATKYTTAANAILLQYTAPVYIALFGKFFLNEKTEAYDWFFIGLIIIGMVLFFHDDIGGGSFFGNLLGVLSGVAFAFNVISIRKQKDGNAIEGIFWGNVFTFIISIPFMFGPKPNAVGWTSLILLGVFQLGISYILYVKAMKHVTAIEGVLIPIIEPILNPFWVFLFLKEQPGKWTIIGGIIVISAVTLRSVLATLRILRHK